MAHITYLTRINDGAENQADLFRVWTRDRSVGDRSSRAILDVRIYTAPIDETDVRAIEVGAVDSATFQATKGHLVLHKHEDAELRASKGDIASYLTDARLLALMGRVYAPTAPTFTEPKPTAPAAIQDVEDDGDPEDVWNSEDF